MPEEKTIFVLGAGFSKGFLPNAPLLVGDFDIGPLIEKFDENHFPIAHHILNAELKSKGSSGIDIERLMTRLDGHMPYDFQQKGIQELDHLYHHVKEQFIKGLNNAIEKYPPNPLLQKFAAYCIENKFDCITFNYDDVLDQALWKHKEVFLKPREYRPYWHPDGGYGFFCRPADSLVEDQQYKMEETSMLLLKLHGSINWRIRLGAPPPYDVHSIIHFQSWYPPKELWQKLNFPPENLIERHLKDERFIVLPVLMKSALTEEPMMRLLWSLAFEKLSASNKVVFIGYSFPRTDIAARFLFSEGLRHLNEKNNSKIWVVNRADDDSAKRALREVYREVFPDIPDKQFEFGGTLEYCRNLVKDA